MFKLLTILLYSITIFYNFSMANSTVGLVFGLVGPRAISPELNMPESWYGSNH